MRAVIIDDERLAQEGLKSLLSDHPDVVICGVASNVKEALSLVERERPDLMFLDIEMTGRNGFDLLEALEPPHPQVVFVTAYSAHAVKAFEVNALDYLLKPVHPQRLAAALEKVRGRLGSGTSRPVKDEPSVDCISEKALREDDHVFVRDGDRCWFVPVRSIRLLESEGNHTRVHFDGENPLLYRTLGQMEARLPERLFLRVNRSQLVNLSHIESIGQWFSGSLKVTLRGGMELEFSRRQAQIFRERMSL